METEHHQWSANNLGVDRQNLTRREEELSRKVDDLPLLWHLVHPIKNLEAKELLKIKQLTNDIGLMLTAIATGDMKHLEHMQRMSELAAGQIVIEVRAKIEASGVPITDLTLLQSVELFNEIHQEVLSKVEQTVFGEENL